MLFIVSDVQLGPAAAAAESLTDARLAEALEAPQTRTWTVEAATASGEKCPRCWRVVPEISSASETAGLCLRCADALSPAGSAAAGGGAARDAREPRAARRRAGPLPPADATSSRAYARPIEMLTILIIVAVDQLTKEIVRRTLPLHGEPLEVIPGLLDLTHVQNTGAAFGLLNAVDFAYKPAVMIGIAALALVAIASYATQLGFHERLARIGLSLILGGAFGNLIDRALSGSRRRLRRRLLGLGALLGFQRRRRRDYDRRRPRPSRHDWFRTTSCIPFCLKSAGSRSTPTALLLAAAYLLGLQFALVRGRARGLDPNRIMDLGIWIIISALVGAKLMLVVVDCDTFQWNWQSFVNLFRVGGRVLRRADRGGRRRVVVPLAAPDADVDRRPTCSRPASRSATSSAGSGACSPAAASAGRPTCPGRSRSTIQFAGANRRHAARRAAAPDAALRSRRRAADPRSCCCSRSGAAGRFRAGRSGATCCSTPSRASSSSSTAATRARRSVLGRRFRRRSSCRCCSCRWPRDAGPARPTQRTGAGNAATGRARAA